MDWLPVYEIGYILIVILVCLRIIYDTRSHTKTLAYLLFAILVPVAGIIFYFVVGINYRKRKLYGKKLIENELLGKKLEEDVRRYSKDILKQGEPEVKDYKELAVMLLNDNMSPLTGDNDVKLLVNGENKFPDVLQAIAEAKDHIHIEYYIYDDDKTGGEVADALIKKAKEGVTIRFIYDDFGSRSIRKKMARRLREAGISVFPFHKIIFIAFANRLNYRNHRKIVVVDGRIAFVGGINVSDRYVNRDKKQKLFWRDTHVRIEGPGVRYLQYLFLCDWNFCAKEGVLPSEQLFPPPSSLPVKGNKIVQIASSGPDSTIPTILFSILQGINLAEKEVLISTPYFIPSDSIMDSLMASALGGVKIIIMVPYKSDSVFVNAAARSYYGDVLDAGVEIYRYKKGFLHSKTMVIDRKVAIVGSANMDYRSFDLNFEVNAIVYDDNFAEELADVFFNDLEEAEQINPEEWKNRPIHSQLIEKAAGLGSPLL